MLATWKPILLITVFVTACSSPDPSMGVVPGDRGEAGKGDSLGSCSESDCGGMSSDGCWCDDECEGYGDCCGDMQSVCTCEPTECAVDQCGDADDGCGGIVDCGACAEPVLDPFDPASCNGQPLSEAEALDLIELPDTTYFRFGHASLDDGTIHIRTRTCYEATSECTEWAPHNDVYYHNGGTGWNSAWYDTKPYMEIDVRLYNNAPWFRARFGSHRYNEPFEVGDFEVSAEDPISYHLFPEDLSFPMTGRVTDRCVQFLQYGSQRALSSGNDVVVERELAIYLDY